MNHSKTKIIIIDEEAEKHKKVFEATYPLLNEINDIELEFIQTYIESTEVRDSILFYTNEDHSLLSFAMCTLNDDINLRKALTLPKIVYDKKIPIYVYQHADAMFNVDDNMVMFGPFDQYIDLTLQKDKLAKKFYEFECITTQNQE